MNSIDFNQVGGFPMTTNILAKMQTAFSIFNALGNIVGDKTIISGCIVSGSNVSDGVVYLNGEVFEFRGGLAQTKVIIKEEVANLLFQNGNSNPTIKTRYVTFGTGIGAIDWMNFKHGFETKAISEALGNKAEASITTALAARIKVLEDKPAVSGIPVGLIAIWGRQASEIPTGWAEYTPLKGRVPVGLNSADAEFSEILNFAGSKTKKLEIAELPRHRMKLDTKVPKELNDSDRGGGYSNFSLDNTADAYTEWIGNDQPFSIMNPYRVVLFIEYKG
jgi:hypothetical protein